MSVEKRITKEHWFLFKHIVFRCFMVLELNCSSHQSFIIQVNGTILHFTLRNFAIISGLNCVGDEDKFKFDTQESNRLMKKYFEGKIPIKKRDLIESFVDKVWGDNDEDALKIAILYFIHTYVYSGKNNCKLVPRRHFDLVESGRYKEYPWGKLAFMGCSRASVRRCIIQKSIREFMTCHLLCRCVYMNAAPLSTSRLLKKFGNHIPRLLNWKTLDSHPRYKSLMKGIFSDVNNKLNFRNIAPTLKEIAVFQLPTDGIEIQKEKHLTDSSHSDSSSTYDKNSDDDFQEVPPS